MKNDQSRNPFPKLKGEKAEIVTANAVGAGFKPVPTKPRFVEMSVMFFHANRQPLATKHCFSTLKGFTLLETLVALAIIGVSMAAAMRSTHFSIDVVSDLKKRTAASWVAQNQLNQLRASRQFPEPGAASGQARQGDQEFNWRQEVSVTPNYSFRRVEIKVFSLDDAEHFVAQQVGYVARNQD